MPRFGRTVQKFEVHKLAVAGFGWPELCRLFAASGVRWRKSSSKLPADGLARVGVALLLCERRAGPGRGGGLREHEADVLAPGAQRPPLMRRLPPRGRRPDCAHPRSPRSPPPWPPFSPRGCRRRPLPPSRGSHGLGVPDPEEEDRNVGRVFFHGLATLGWLCRARPIKSKLKRCNLLVFVSISLHNQTS